MFKFPNTKLNPFASHPMVRTTIYIPPIDSHLLPHEQQITRETRLIETAREGALANRPSKDDKSPDETQYRIAARIGEGMNLLAQFGASQTNLALDRLRPLMPQPLNAHLALSEIDIEIAEPKADLRETMIAAGRDEELARRRVAKFRRDHGIGNRKAEYAQTAWQPAAWTSVLLLADALANTALFKDVGPLGDVGGFILALQVSGVNVGLGFGIGWFPLRRLFHIHAGYRLLGGALACVLIPLGLLWNYVVAGYRQALESNQSAGFLDLHRLAHPAAWLQGASFYSMLLFFVGLAVFALAMVEGFGGQHGFWDLYPGLKERDLDHRRAEAEKANLKAELRERIHGALLKLRQQLSDRLKAEAEAIRIMQMTAGQADDRARDVADSLGEWARLGAILVTRYRAENMAVRTDDPPAYFAIQMPMPGLDGAPSAAMVTALAEQGKAVHVANVAAVTAVLERIAELTKREAEIVETESTDVEQRARALADIEWHEDSATDAPDVRMAAE